MKTSFESIVVKQKRRKLLVLDIICPCSVLTSNAKLQWKCLFCIAYNSGGAIRYLILKWIVYIFWIDNLLGFISSEML